MKVWSLRVILISAAILWIAVVGVSWSEASDDAGTEKTAQFSWLDPEKKIYVLQNRKYTKANRVLLSAMGQVSFSSPYRNAGGFDVRGGYYFTEMLGVEFFYRHHFNGENTTYGNLIMANSSVIPVVREIRQEYGGLFHFTPWYAKINVFNQILYFDWYFGLGGGLMQTALDTRSGPSAPASYESESLLGVFVTTGHLYHLNETFSIRLDFTGSFYSAPISPPSTPETIFSNLGFGLGLGVRL